MSKPIVYIDRSDVKPGSVADLRQAVVELDGFVQSREPQLLSYGFYLDEDALRMAVVAIHPNSASLELHLRVGGPEFRKVGRFITLREIEVFGEPTWSHSSSCGDARVLGAAEVIVHSADAAFDRLGSHAALPAAVALNPH